jgi:hypothetical protein
MRNHNKKLLSEIEVLEEQELMLKKQNSSSGKSRPNL